MRNIIFLSLMMVFCVVPLCAQGGGDEYDRANLFVGYSHNRVDTGGEDDALGVSRREGFNGFNASVTGNVSRYLGIKFDYSFHRKSFTVEGVNVNAKLNNFLGGVQIKDNAKEGKRVRPFAHLLVGAARTSADAGASGINVSLSETGFAGAFGGGLDVRLGKRADFRLVQLDYNPVRTDGATSHNFRIGVGIVFH